jgi:hypothetical protein
MTKYDIMVLKECELKGTVAIRHGKLDRSFLVFAPPPSPMMQYGVYKKIIYDLLNKNILIQCENEARFLDDDDVTSYRIASAREIAINYDE